MTTDLKKAQLATILSALDDRPRNPANKNVALEAIAKSAGRYGLTAEAVLGVAPGLLDGRLAPADFRAELHDLAGAERQAPAERAPGGDSDERAEPDDASDIPEFLRRNKAPAPAAEQATGPAGAADEAPAAAEPAAAASEPGTKPRRTPREGTKQSHLVALLRRPEGATVDEIAAKCGWQRHTVRGAMAGALKKKLGLTIASEKDEKRGRVYRIVEPA